MPDGALGVAWPSLRAEVDQPLPALGVLLAVLTVGYLITSAGLGRLAGRIGGGPLLAASGVVGSAAMVGYATAPSWPVVVLSALAFGTTAGVLDAGLNAHAALRHGSAALNLLHAGFGAGAAVGPLLVTGLLVLGASWRWAFVALAVVYAGLAVAYWATRTRWALQPAPTEAAAARSSLPRLPLALGAITFFVYVGVEVAAGQWAFSLLTEGRGFAEGTAGTCVAVYWGSLTVGRLLVGALARGTRPDTVLWGAAAGAVLGTTLLWWSPVAAAGPLGLAILGLSLAPVFPTLVAVTPSRIGAGRTASAVGIQVAAGGLGAGVLPFAVGLVMDATTLEALGPLLLTGAVTLVVLQTAASRPGPSLAP